MRNKLLIIIILLVIVISFIPMLDGYLFRSAYNQQIDMLRKVLAEQNPNQKNQFQIQSENYQLGWFKSTADLKLTAVSQNSNTAIPPLTLEIKSIIHHGPIVFSDKNMQLAYANMESYVYLPAFLNGFGIQDEKSGFMQINTLISLDGNRWTSHYSIPAKTFGMGSWQGLLGVTIIDVRNNMIDKMTSNAVFGKLNFAAGMLQVVIEPFKTASEGKRSTENTWNGKSTMSLSSLSIKWQEGRTFSITNLMGNSTYGTTNNLYHYDAQTSLDKIQLPSNFPVTNISNFVITLNVNDLNADILQAYANYKASFKNDVHSDDVLKILMPTSNLALNASMNSEQGTMAASLKVSLLAVPKTQNEIDNNLKANFSMRIAQPFFEKLLTYYIGQFAAEMGNATSVNTTQTQTVIGMLIQQGYIQQDKTDYTILLDKQGETIMLNGKPISRENLQMIPTVIMQDIMKVLPANPAPAPAMQTTTPMSVGTTPTATGNHCYWMNSSSGRNIWILVEGLSKQQCYMMDSCGGGMHQSGGGCYKWAASANAKAIPWSSPN